MGNKDQRKEKSAIYEMLDFLTGEDSNNPDPNLPEDDDPNNPDHQRPGGRWT